MAGQVDTLGLSLVNPAPPSFSSSCLPHDGTHHTPHLFDCVYFSFSLLLKALNGPLVWKERQWSSFSEIIYNHKNSFKKRMQERQFQREACL